VLDVRSWPISALLTAAGDGRLRLQSGLSPRVMIRVRDWSLEPMSTQRDWGLKLSRAVVPNRAEPMHTLADARSYILALPQASCTKMTGSVLPNF
jgi:hypothetical protein